MRSEKVQSIISYFTGGFAMSSPAWMTKLQSTVSFYNMVTDFHSWIQFATDIFQFLTVFIGFVLVVMRLRYDIKKILRNKDEGS